VYSTTTNQDGDFEKSRRNFKQKKMWTPGKYDGPVAISVQPISIGKKLCKHFKYRPPCENAQLFMSLNPLP
jgi:hypothetical protein